MTRLLAAAIVVSTCWAIGISHASADTLTFVCDYNSYSDEKGAHAETNFQLTFVTDKNTGKTYMVGNNGSSEVTPIKSDYGVSFLEATDTGNVMVTSIVIDSMKTVHSRNSIIAGRLVPSQHYGSCELR